MEVSIIYLSPRAPNTQLQSCNANDKLSSLGMAPLSKSIMLATRIDIEKRGSLDVLDRTRKTYWSVQSWLIILDFKKEESNGEGFKS